MKTTKITVNLASIVAIIATIILCTSGLVSWWVVLLILLWKIELNLTFSTRR